jgi:raffinose/stachyose/melibiose transport system substrate-binding protein
MSLNQYETDTPRRAPMSRRTVMALSALAAATLALSACSSSAGSTTSASSGAAESTVSFFSWDTQPTMQPVIDGFEKANPGIKVDFSYSPPVTQYVSTLQTRLRSGTASDVFIITAENKLDLMGKNLVKDLSKEPFMSNIAQAAKDTYTKDGATYGAAVASWGGGILYNKDLLAKAGITTEPKTWSEFLADGAKLKAAGITPFLEPGDGITVTLAALLGIKNKQLGGSMDADIWAKKQTFASTWTDPLTTWSQLFSTGMETSAAAGLTGDQVMAEFEKGDVAMIGTGSWALGTIKTAAPTLNVSFEAVPGTDGTLYWVGAVSPGYAINAKAQHPVAAEKFVEYLQSKEGVELYQKQTQSITTTADFTPTLDPALTEMATAVRAGQFYLPQVSWPTHADVMGPEAAAQMQQLIAGSSTPAAMAAALDAKLASVGN